MLQHIKQIREDRFVELNEVFERCLAKHSIEAVMTTIITNKEETYDQAVGECATGATTA